VAAGMFSLDTKRTGSADRHLATLA
jgi:hypothetical protein